MLSPILISSGQDSVKSCATWGIYDLEGEAKFWIFWKGISQMKGTSNRLNFMNFFIRFFLNWNSVRKSPGNNDSEV